MMTSDFLQYILAEKDRTAWNYIFNFLHETFSEPFISEIPIESQVISRERKIENIDTLLSDSAWDLWQAYNMNTDKTSENIIDFWQTTKDGKAILILDGLSLREMPFLLQGGKARGYDVDYKITSSETPSETTFFAKSLGFKQRSLLENNGGSSPLINEVTTDCIDLPWKDCSLLIKSEPNWFIWHTWPDDKIHASSNPGKGVRDVVKDSQRNLTSNDFWEFIESLTQGRDLIITSDHGYAASGLFPDVVSKEQSDYLRKTFKSGRYIKHENKKNEWVPPTDLQLDTNYGSYRFALGRRKWKSAGGYPTLSHGGLSLLEVAVPFIKITR